LIIGERKCAILERSARHPFEGIGGVLSRGIIRKTPGEKVGRMAGVNLWGRKQPKKKGGSVLGPDEQKAVRTETQLCFESRSP